MKTRYSFATLLALVLVAFMIPSSRTNAQVLGPIQLNVYDSLQNGTTNYICSTPGVYNAFVNVSGNSGSNTIDSVNYEINWGDGNTSYITDLPTNSPPNYFSYIGATHTYTTNGVFTLTFTAVAYSGGTAFAADTLIRPGGIVVNNCEQVSGMVTADMDNDCTFNGPDIALAYAWIQITDASNNVVGYTSTDAYGYYSTALPVGGTYTLQMGNPLGSATYNCTSGPNHTFTLTAPYTHDFMLHHSTSGFDLAVSYMGGGVALNTLGNLWVDISELNQSGVTLADVSIQLPNGVSPGYSNHSYTQAGNTITFTGLPVQGLQWYWYSYIYVQLSASSSVLSLGDTVCFDVQVTPTAGDLNAANNNAQYCTVVVNSYDPNNKLVMPSDDGMTGGISSGEDLKYTINFQNTGNAPAINIDVVDTLDADFDMSLFHVNATSHPCNVSISGHVVTFHFPNINLPDSTSNEPMSHGSIQYSIQAPFAAAVGTVFDNMAYIYFDNNPPILTNNTQLTVEQLSVGEENETATVSVYPNPASDKLFVQLTQTQNALVELVNMEGRSILYRTVMSQSNEIDLSGIAPGVYTLRIHTDNTTEVVKVVVQR